MNRLSITFLGVLCMTALMAAAPIDTRLADAAMRGDREIVRSLLKQADVNGAQGDGMTALHWTASRDDVDMTQMLLSAGANTKAVTRMGGFTPLWMAAQTGNPRTIELLLKAGADANVSTSTGVTPLMIAAAAGNVDAINVLVDHKADVNAKENNYGQTPLIFAASYNRAEAIKALIVRGADVRIASKVRAAGGRGGGGGAATARGARATPTVTRNEELLSITRNSIPLAPSLNTTEGNSPPRGEAPDQPQTEDAPRPAQEAQGGLTPLLYAARQGHFEATRTLLENGAGINELSGDNTTPLMMAIINGHYDLAMMLLDRGADPKIATAAGGTPLYRVVDLEWGPKSFYPQPNAKQEKVGYLDLMKALLAHGANPNARLTRALWYTGYGFELDGVEVPGATAFWRAAQVGDLDAMKLLVAAGADPNLATTEGVTPLLVAAGDGFHGNDAVTVPAGRMPAVKYLVEVCGADVNALDQKAGTATSITHTNSRAYTPLHSAAARGDNEMILYLVSKGAKVDIVGKNGLTAADMANGPRERIQPFPETVELLVRLGSKNSNKCVSC